MAAKKKNVTDKDVEKYIEKKIETWFSKFENMDCSGKKTNKVCTSSASGGCAWLLGFIGALVYFWQYVDSFGTGLVAIFKACIWPAFFVYHLFKFLSI